MQQIHTQIGSVLIAACLVVGFFAVPAAANLTIEKDVSYNGTRGETQPVRVNLTLTPEVVNEDITVSLAETDSALIDQDTVSSPQPGVNQTGPMEFSIDRLEPGEEVTIVFDAYPKALQEPNISVAVIRWNSEQVPEGNAQRVEADISDSPLIRLEAAQERIDELETTNDELQGEIRSLERWSLFGPLALGGGLVVAVGMGVGMYFWRNRSVESYIDRTYTYIIKYLDNQQNDPTQYEPARELADDLCDDVLNRELPERHLPHSEGWGGPDQTDTDESGGGFEESGDTFGDIEFEESDDEFS